MKVKASLCWTGNNLHSVRFESISNKFKRFEVPTKGKTKKEVLQEAKQYLEDHYCVDKRNIRFI